MRSYESPIDIVVGQDGRQTLGRITLNRMKADQRLDGAYLERIPGLANIDTVASLAESQSTQNRSFISLAA
jgi:hypothetical protein